MMDHKRRTALHLAAEGGHVGVVDVLLGLGVSMQAKDGEGLTALHVAASKGHEEFVRLLVHKGADFKSQSQLGLTALHVAAAGVCARVPSTNRGAHLRMPMFCCSRWEESWVIMFGFMTSVLPRFLFTRLVGVVSTERVGVCVGIGRYWCLPMAQLV